MVMVMLTAAAFMILAAITPLAALVVLLILAPLRTLIATEARLQLPLDVGQLTLIALLGVWLMYRIVRKQPLLSFKWSPIYMPLTIFLICIAPGAFIAASTGAWFNEWLKWIQIVILVTFCLNMAAGHQWQWLVFGLAVAGAANALIGIYEYFGGSGALHLVINERYFRAFGTFGQPNPFGGFMGLLAPLVLMTAFGYGLRLWSAWRARRVMMTALVSVLLFYTAAGALITAGIYLSWSRGAWLGFICALAVMAFALPRKIWQGVTLIAIAAGFALLLLFSGRLSVSLVARFTTAEEYSIFDDMRGVDITPANYAVVERLAHWQAALNMARENPYFGVGMGNYEVVYDGYRLLNWIFPLGHAHNYYLNIFAEAGIIGLLAYIVVWVWVVWMSWQTRQHPDCLARCVAVGLLGTWTYLTVHSVTDNLYVNNLFLHIGVMLGILAVLHRQIHQRIYIGSS
jgi:O-antigen ligase